MDQEPPAPSASSSSTPAPVPTNSIEATPATPTPGSAPVAAANEKEPGKASGPCPAATDQSPQILRQALELEKKTTDPGPHRAIAEAIRIRLDALFQHGCYRYLDDEHLLEAIVQIADDPKDFAERLDIKNRGDLGILASYGTYSGGFVAQYRWHDGMIRTSIIVTGQQGDLDKQLLVLSVKLAKLANYPEPVLVLGNTHPWMSSCWRSMRLRILAPSGDPVNPKALLDKPTGGRWCEGITSRIQGDMVTFEHDNWGGPWSMALVQRPYSYRYEYVDGKMVERFGFPPRLQDLPEEWLMQEWNLSQEGTIEEARDRLQSVHEKLRRPLLAHEKTNTHGDSEYSQEMFPVSETERRIALYCITRESEKPCKHWPKPVDVFIERRGEKWYVKDVAQRAK